LQVQLVAGLEEIEREEETAPRSRHEFQLKVAKPLFFDGDLVKVVGFVIVCKLYIRMRIREESVKG